MIERKRQNFDVSPEQEAELLRLREALAAPTIKDAVLRAARLVSALSQELRGGGTLWIRDFTGHESRLVLPDLEAVEGDYVYLVQRPHPWMRQLFIKGRRVRAFTIFEDMKLNKLSNEDAAENWDLPLQAILELVHYCEANVALIQMEAQEERHRASVAGVEVEPAAAA